MSVCVCVDPGHGPSLLGSGATRCKLRGRPVREMLPRVGAGSVGVCPSMRPAEGPRVPVLSRANFLSFALGWGCCRRLGKKGRDWGCLACVAVATFRARAPSSVEYSGRLSWVRVDGACGLLQPVSTLSGALGWHVHVPIGMVKPPCGGWCCAALHSASAMVVMAESLLLGAFLADDEPDRRLPPCRRRCWSCSACRRRTSFSARAMRLISRW